MLSSIILVALTGVFRKFKELGRLYNLAKIDFSIWLVSFVATVSWNVTMGLAISVAYALMTVVFRTQWPRSHLLSNLPGTEDFKDVERYKHIVDFDVNYFL